MFIMEEIVSNLKGCDKTLKECAEQIKAWCVAFSIASALIALAIVVAKII